MNRKSYHGKRPGCGECPACELRAKGFAEGTIGVTQEELERDTAGTLGRFTGGVVIPGLMLKGVPRIVRGLKAKPVTPPAGARLAPKPPTLEQSLVEVLEEARKPTPPSKVSLQPPPFGETPRPAQPRVSFSERAPQTPAATQPARVVPFQKQKPTVKAGPRKKSPEPPTEATPLNLENAAADAIRDARSALGSQEAASLSGLTRTHKFDI